LQIREAITAIQIKLNPKHTATKTASRADSLDNVLDTKTAQIRPNRSTKPQETVMPKATQIRNLDLLLFLGFLSSSNNVFTKNHHFLLCPK
jgi:hypothetical protein